jgi:hypothetical protein
MANIAAWMSGAERVWANGYIPKSTVLTYSQIRELGLDTVKWDAFSPKTPAEVLRRSKKFISRNSPCLLIWDPRDPDGRLQKGYHIGLKDITKIRDGLRGGNRVVSEYNFLLTTQIDNPGDGFVGSVYSDGRRKIVCETLHSEGVYNHQELSQSGAASLKTLDWFVVDNFFEGGSIPRLKRGNARKITEMYGGLRGYFEFIAGVQRGKWGIYTIGYERGFNILERHHSDLFINARGKRDDS